MEQYVFEESTLLVSIELTNFPKNPADGRNWRHAFESIKNEPEGQVSVGGESKITSDEAYNFLIGEPGLDRDRWQPKLPY
jgi:hypothetical protein